ncbi:protoheme IX farnesyltransferase [Flexivirga sp. ID2601S]|uniref:Protoheme IX farnesyltransferase n=1 Tax=Flexivirga aerilata TaxID=1656889 RepID=A0A849AMU3_9MICO|nr:heme o synthase [Flexivirga aerilata]NNG41107.1 protoheme IX farnesyltransferase [Flexivirga aerilata]
MGAVIRDYVSLTKPRIIELLLVTTFPVMFLADRGVPSLWLILATLVGGSLSAGSANALNCYLDRDIDRLMHRTEGRPLATGAISPRAGLTFGLVLGVVSVLWLGLLVNWLSAALSLAAIVLYVGFYTLLLKRRTSQNIVWGGVAGCMPALIGWSAVTNSLSWSAVVLFLIVFFWTPPHYWPLSMRFRDDYASAGVPMLPVVAEDVAVARQVVIYSWVTVLTTLVLVPVAGMGLIYTAVALVAGGVFLREAHTLLAKARAGASYAELKPMRLFHYSISYLTLVFVAVAIDPLVHLTLH